MLTQVVEVTDGTLNLEFLHQQIDNPLINGIEIIQLGDTVPTGQTGAAIFSINRDSNRIQISNFGNNSFLIENTGEKKITKVELDVTDALYPDTVFDPFGVAGDTVSKPLRINTDEGTGVIEPDNSSYVGTGGIAGFEGIELRFDSTVDGGFESGETLGFSVDMDPNSVAGATKSTLDSGSSPTWDVGGVSGAELIGSTVTVTFEDGTTATSQLQGNDNQGGSQAFATQSVPQLDVDLTVNGLSAGGVGTYDAAGPSVIVNGPAGQTARVVLTKGFIQPGNNNFDEPYRSQLDSQLATLAASDFPANNAVEFQTVDVLLTGDNQDISSLFDLSNVDSFDFVGEDQLPVGFVASIIDPDNSNLPIGPVTQPIYLQFEDDDGTTVPVVSVANDSVVVNEAESQLQLLLNTDVPVPTDETINVTFEVVPGTALAGEDYVLTGGTFDEATGIYSGIATINSGSSSAAINLEIVQDTIAELDEAFTLNITGVSANAQIGDASTAVTIEDNDSTTAPTVSILNGDSSVTEGIGQVQISLATDIPVPSDETVNVSFEIVPGSATAAEDYEFLEGTFDEATGIYTGTVSIAGGSGDVTFNINVVQDVLEEADEAFTVNITGISANAQIGTDSATITIEDDDGAPPTSNTVLYRVNAGGSEIAAIDGGPNWSADTRTLNSPFLTNPGNNLTASFAVAAGSTVAATTPIDIFQSERWDRAPGDDMQWAFDTPEAGQYEVRLFVGNGFGGTSEPGQRVFDVAVEGAVPATFDDIDLSAQFGHLTGGMLTQVVEVTDGTL
ncbi:MAG: Calx-beta domain-containing protein, partial [Pseudomonadota bacterium]